MERKEQASKEKKVKQQTLSEGLKKQKGIEEIKNAAGVRLSYLCEVMKELKWAKTRAKSLTDIKL